MGCNVLIVGAGPSGLFMAAELARQGLSLRIIDKVLTPSDKSRALAIQARTLEILYFLGIADRFISEGLKITHFSPISNQKKLTTLSFDRLDSPFPFILSLEQNKTEALLASYLAEFDIKVERGVELLSFNQDEGTVTSILHNHENGKQEEVKTDWLIGCDGPHSTVRKQLNLAFDGREFPDIFSLADVHVKWKYPPNQGMAFLDPRGILAAIPMKGEKRYRLIFQPPRNKMNMKNLQLIHGEVPGAPTLAEIEELVARIADPNVRLSDPLWIANFHVNSRIINNYREKRIFLVGDAAHIHSPVGGQGMNTGIQDAFNLGWKLGAIFRGKASPSLLDSYEFERKVVGKALLRGTEKITDLIFLHSKLLIILRNFILCQITKFASIRHRIISNISQIAIHYPTSEWVVERAKGAPGILAGYRGRDAKLFSQNQSTSLFALWQKSKNMKILVIKEKKGMDAFISSLERIEGVEVYILPDAFEDRDKEIERRYGMNLIYVIRPDGYIGYRGLLNDQDSLKDYLKNLIIRKFVNSSKL